MNEEEKRRNAHPVGEPAPLEPIPMCLWCPMCGERHIDEGEWATRVHATHSCQRCGLTWRPAVVPTVGVQFLPGFKNDDPNDLFTYERWQQLRSAMKDRLQR